ncbi:MAG: hypothetical protein QM692_19315 [Thermomicrobiales bacterium]
MLRSIHLLLTGAPDSAGNPAPSRRSLVGGLASGLATLMGGSAAFEVEAKRKRKKKKKRKNRNKNGGGNGNGGNGGGGDLPCTLGCVSSTCGQTPAACPILPANNIWNARVDTAPVDANSAPYVASIGNAGLHPDFGAGLYEGRPFGIPFVRVPAGQPMVAVSFDGWPEESDPGPYPVPPDAPVEGGSCSDGDRHVLVVQEGSCMLYELYDARQQANGSWVASTGAVFDLRSNALRPAGWTSADAAGFPILPGLVRYEEIVAGVIDHALRFTAARTRTSYVWPATHQAGSTGDAAAPPMGQRFRLKSSVNIATFSPTNQIILQALKTYGMVLADNGSNWYLSGAPDDRWDNDDLHELQNGIHGSDFEAVNISGLMVSASSGEAL